MKKASCQSLVYIVNSYFFANNRCQLSVSMSTSSQSDYNRNYKYNCNEHSYKLHNVKSYNIAQRAASMPSPTFELYSAAQRSMARSQILTLPNSWCSWQGRFLFASIWGSLLCMIWKVRCPGGKMERLRAKRRCFSFCDLNRARKLFRPFHQTGLAHRVVSFGHVGSDAYQFFRVGLPRLP